MNVLIGLLEYEHGKVELEYEEFLSKQDLTPKSGHYYKIKIDDKITFFSPSLTSKNFSFDEKKVLKKTTNKKYFLSVGPANENLIVMKKTIKFHHKKITLYVAENIDNKLVSITNFKIFTFIIFLFFIAIYSISMYFIIKKSFNPLEELSYEIETITHKNINKIISLKTNDEELVVLVNSFNRMIQRLDNAFQTEKNVIAEASHKLKTPISVIKTHCQIILSKDRNKEDYIESIKIINNYINQITRLITDILSIAYLDSEEILSSEDKNISILACIKDALEILTYSIKEKQIIIKINNDDKDDVFINADKNKIIDIFYLILENAIKYNKLKGEIEIKFYSENNYNIICFIDTGIGISEKDLKNIFDRFYRSNEVSNIEGSGLGLSIAKKIVEKYNGKIEVESILDKGSCFKVFLPII
ncbi:MAG: HAMP domain-containing sensor histidine kinase [Candidatus Sericytochromatia bacterium]